MLFAFKAIISDMLMSAPDLHVVHNQALGSTLPHYWFNYQWEKPDNQPLRCTTASVTHCMREFSTAHIRPVRAFRPSTNCASRTASAGSRSVRHWSDYA